MRPKHSRRLGALARTACATVALLALIGSATDGSEAVSSDIYSHVGEIALVGFNYVPAGWVPADGRSLPIEENEALFNLIGTTYGGDGSSTFNVPKIDAPAPGTSYVIAQVGVYPGQ